MTTSYTGLKSFDATLHKTHIFVNDLAAELGIEDKHKTFQGLRATLHVLRDRLTVEEAAQLGAQLPILLAGYYYENWRPGATPTKERSKEEFLVRVSEEIENEQIDPGVPSEQLVRAVFKIISKHVTEGEIKDIVLMMPQELRELWPEAIRT